ncbi:hypothetical protein ACFYVL_39960 [Streptomyces sp. NPDC004111]|uniref:hypothetical protein n=1 Tax=Streptomyces sp. NPDC004111 TaxID=3364690 RepID=UPI0036A1EB14
MATKAHVTPLVTGCLRDFGALSTRQVRGADCVVCGIALTARTAVDLGVRERPDGAGRWFPRACGTHPQDEADDAATIMRIPTIHGLTYTQYRAWACVGCGVTLTDVTGAHHIGYARGRQGAHILDCEAWACTSCVEATR